MKEQFEKFMAECPAVAILRGITNAEVTAVCDALYEAGIRLLEIPLNSPDAIKSIAIASEHCKGRMAVGAGTVLTGNKTLVYTIIKNLVENSLKYAGNDITIHLECYSSIDKFCYLTYYDTGTGVPAEHLDQIFERFYRIEEGRTRDVGGSGLGLSIVKNAVKFHGGDIRVINRQWGGLQFFFSLRRQED